MKALLAITACVALTSIASAETLLEDDFSQQTLTARRAIRGEWAFNEKTAICTQDDALYKKNKDHGPIIFYNLGYRDATIRMSYKAEAAKSVVFTCNNDQGHVFRFVASERGTSIRAFPADSTEHTSVELARGPALKLGEWTDIEVAITGSKVALKIGKDFAQVVDHSAISAAKTNLSIGFAFGTFSVWDVKVTSP
jgi:hypothetical protein